MKHATLVCLSLLGVSCHGTVPPLASQTPGEASAAADSAAPEIVQVDVEDASGPEVVCSPVTRPGTRIVVGEICTAAERSGVNAQTREHIQREISGQGWSSGWKTDAQIEAERRVSFGGR